MLKMMKGYFSRSSLFSKVALQVKQLQVDIQKNNGQKSHNLWQVYCNKQSTLYRIQWLWYICVLPCIDSVPCFLTLNFRHSNRHLKNPTLLQYLHHPYSYFQYRFADVLNKLPHLHFTLPNRNEQGSALILQQTNEREVGSSNPAWENYRLAGIHYTDEKKLPSSVVNSIFAPFSEIYIY